MFWEFFILGEIAKEIEMHWYKLNLYEEEKK